MTLRDRIQLAARLRQLARSHREPRNEGQIHVFSQYCKTSSCCRSERLYWFCTLTMLITLRARSISFGFTSLSPTCRIFPCFLQLRRSAPATPRPAPWDRSGATAIERWNPSSASAGSSRLAEPGIRAVPTGCHWSGPCRVSPALVATTSPFGKGDSASPIKGSLTAGP